MKFDNEEISIPGFQPLIDELETFESRKTKNNRMQYGHPEIKDMHDDCVFSLCLALWQAPKVKKRDSMSPKDRKTLLMDKYKQFSGQKRNKGYGYRSHERKSGF